ncbi:transposase [Aeromonas veronii]|uniref:transposase n=1 Tax=Aeromonas veronii TaxID=654 RepID=UPI003D24021C
MVYNNSRTNGSRKGRANYSREFKQRLVEAANQPGVAVSKLAQEHGVCRSANIIKMPGTEIDFQTKRITRRYWVSCLPPQ